jgi:Beta-lactamase superfamily domain
MKRSLHIGLLALLSLTLLAGCTPAATPPPPTAAPASAADTPAPTNAPQESKVKLIYEGNAQFELVGSQGTRILIDIADPTKLTSPATDKDVLLTTHSYHTDHYNKAFATAFPGKQLLDMGTLELPGIAVKTIASTHSAGANSGKMIVFIIDMDGLRIAHFGSAGQKAFTQEQLDQLGTVDMALTLLNGNYSFDLMEQLKPKLVIPTHGSDNMDVAKRGIGLWKDAYADSGWVTIGRSDLPAGSGTKLLVLGDSFVVAACQNLYKMPKWSE